MPLFVGVTANGTAAVGQLPGTTTNDAAAAGKVGEFISAVNNTPVNLTTGTPANITSISLTAGDWDVTTAISFITGATTTVTYVISMPSLVTANIDARDEANHSRVQYNALVLGSAINRLWTGPVRFSLSSTTTIFLVVEGAFGVSTLTSIGYIRARRVR